ncbi:hypothetical protein BDW68DRAFT_147009 [Aspergillus falconensis]
MCLHAYQDIHFCHHITSVNIYRCTTYLNDAHPNGHPIRGTHKYCKTECLRPIAWSAT